MYIFIKGKRVFVSGDKKDLAVVSHQFQDWVANLDPEFTISHVHFNSVTLKETDDGVVVRFIEFRVDYADAHKHRESVIFMRGASVVNLTILRCEGKEYIPLTQQPRIATGMSAFPEISAGTMERYGSFLENAVREHSEELGMIAQKETVIDLTGLVYGDRFRGVFASPGGTDEFFRFFLTFLDVTPESLSSLEGKQTGLESENERIILKVIPLENLIFEAPDGKSIIALALYREAQRLGKI